MRIIRSALRQRRGIALLAAVVALLGVATQVMVPALTGSAIDVATGTRSGEVRNQVLLLLAVALIDFVVQFLRRYSASLLATGTEKDMRDRLLSTLLGLDGPATDKLVTGQIVSRAISDLSGLYTAMVMGPLLLMRLVQFIAIILIMLWMSPLLTLVALGVIPILIVVASRSRRSVYAATWAAQQQTAEVATHVEQSVTGIRIVKAFAQEMRMNEQLEKLAHTLYSMKMRAAKITARFQPLLSHIPLVALVVSIVIGALLVMQGAVTVGTFFAFTAYLLTLTQTVSMLAGMWVSLQVALSSINRLEEITLLRPERKEPTQSATLTHQSFDLALHNVSFRGVLEDLSLRLIPGKITALVGPPGSGKTLIARLIGGFYQPEEGRITLGGVDYKNLRRETINQHVAVVFDEPILLSATIAENITLGLPAQEEDIRQALYLAEADFVNDLPEGLSTVIGERGLSLSGGQRQRLALARALFHRPKVLVLDDATSAIDSSTEARIMASLRSHLADTAVLTIAHRRSSLALADSVAILDNGRISVSGDLEEVSRTEEFARLMEPKRPGITLDTSTDTFSTEDLWPAHTGENEKHHSSYTPTVGRAIQANAQVLEAVEKLPPATEPPHLPERFLSEPFSVAGLFRPVKWLVLAAITLMIIGVITTLTFPTLMRAAIDRGVGNDDFGYLLLVGLVGLVVVAIAWLAQKLQIVVTSRSGERLLYGLRIRSFRHLLGLSMDYFEKTRAGAIQTRMTTDIDALSHFLQTGLAQAVVSLGTLIGVLGMLVATDGQLALIAAAALPILIIITLIFRRISRQLYTAAREQVSAVNASFQESVHAIEVMQMHGGVDEAQHRFHLLTEHYRRLRMRAQLAVALYFPGVQAISAITSAIVLGIGAAHVEDGRLTTGALIAFLMYLNQLYGPIQQLGSIFDSWQRAQVSFTRITELLHTEPSVKNNSRSPIPEPIESLALNNVEFGYGDEPVLEASLHIKAGETIALVGPTGAGKSTVVKLLARFYNPDSGTVEANDTDIAEFNLPDWRRRMVQVPQEAHLFLGSVADNIRFGKPEASDEEVEAAVARIGALKIISGIEGGFHHVIAEGGRDLSAGQRQIIALARAELMEPSVVLYDEATATLDPATEAIFMEAASRASISKTTVIVAHRLASITHADRILVIDSGRVVEQGSHEELIGGNGLYARLWKVSH